MNIEVQVSFLIIVLCGICPGVGLLDHMATQFLVFWGATVLFSIVAVPISIPTIVWEDLLFSTPSHLLFDG